MDFCNLFIIGGRCIRIKYLDIAIIVLLKQGMLLTVLLLHQEDV